MSIIDKHYTTRMKAIFLYKVFIYERCIFSEESLVAERESKASSLSHLDTPLM